MVAVHAALSGKRQRPLIPLVKVCCDSQTVVRWTASNGIRSSSKSLERVIVRRLIQSIREIMDDLRSVGVNFKLEKVTSEDNRADSLSRAASDWGFDQLEISDPSDDAALFPASEAIHAVQGGERDKCAQPDLPVGATAREAVRSLQEKSPLWSKVVVYLKTGGKADPKVLHAAQEKRIDSEGLLVALRYPGGSTLQSPREVIVIPCDFDEGKAEALRIIKVFHESTHHNARYLSWEVSRFFLIDGLARLARLVCQGCERCQNAITTRFYAGAMGFTDTTAACVWDVVACDIAGPFKPDKDYGFVAALVLIDMYSHYVIIRGLRDQRTITICSVLGAVIHELGAMRQLRSDGAPNLTSRRFRQFAASAGVEHVVANRYSPFQNGMVEKSISNIKTVLRLFPEVLKAKHYGTSHWYSVMCRAGRRANDRPYLGTTPFALWFGRERRPEEVARLSTKPEDKSVGGVSTERKANQEEFDVARSERQLPRRYAPRSLKVSVGSKVKIFRPNQAPGVGHASGYYKDPVYVVIDQEGVNVTLLEVGKSEGDEIVEHIRNIRPYYA